MLRPVSQFDDLEIESLLCASAGERAARRADFDLGDIPPGVWEQLVASLAALRPLGYFRRTGNKHVS
jgi:hypothetical protein